MLKAIRGAATAAGNTPGDIAAATQAMLQEIMAANHLSPQQMVSAIFTLTPDLNAAFPAAAARALGWTDVPMMCAQEIPVPGALAMVVRVLIHADTDAPAHHVYQGGATALRPDWAARQSQEKDGGGCKEMIIVMKKDATEEEIEEAVTRVRDLGYGAHLSRGEERVLSAFWAMTAPCRITRWQHWPALRRSCPFLPPYKLASRDFHPQDTVVKINGISVGGTLVVTMAGPCSVESREQLLETALAVKAAGAQMLRGGAFKPRSSPYSFQGLGLQGLELLAEVGAQVGLPVATEVICAGGRRLGLRVRDHSAGRAHAT